MSKYEKAIDYLQPIADNAELSAYSEALVVALAALRSARSTEVSQDVQRAAMETFGEEKQIVKLSQEIGEFLMAFTQYMEGRDKLSHVAEEMADVHNMLDQWALHLGCEDEVERQKRYKLKRLEQRIEEARKTFSEMERGLRIDTPLTFEELEDMIGEPVWIVDKFEGGGCRWVIVSESILGLFGGYTAYRNKPEEVQQ